ncbi:MAG: acyltransferase family protein [Bacilli bacterium]
MTTRNKTIDLLKGVLVFLVIWGHVIQCSTNGMFDFYLNSIYKFIYSFHMPAFMLISGYLYYYSEQNKNLKTILLRKLKQLLIPIISWGFIFYIFLHITNINDFSLRTCFEAPWFLWSTLCSSLILILSNKLFKGKYKFLFYILFIPITLLFPNRNLNIFMYPYFLIGYLFRKYYNKNNKLVGFLSCIVYFIMLPFFDKKYYIYTTGINFFNSYIKGFITVDMFRWVLGLTGSIVFMIVLKLIYKYFRDLKIINFIIKIGNYPLHFYLIQNVIISFGYNYLYQIICNHLGFNPLFPNQFLYNWFFTPILSIIFLLLMYNIIKFLEKNNKLNFLLFGK